MKLSDVPELDEYMTVTEAGSLLGLTKQGVHKLIASDGIPGVRRKGPVYLLPTAVVTGLAGTRAANRVEAEDV